MSSLFYSSTIIKVVRHLIRLTKTHQSKLDKSLISICDDNIMCLSLSPVALTGPFSEVFSGEGSVEDVVSGSPFQFPNYNSYKYSKIMTPGSR